MRHARSHLEGCSNAGSPAPPPGSRPACAPRLASVHAVAHLREYVARGAQVPLLGHHRADAVGCKCVALAALQHAPVRVERARKLLRRLGRGLWLRALRGLGVGPHPIRSVTRLSRG